MSKRVTYHGRIHTSSDAIILLEACRLGLLPKLRQRLSEKERQLVKSGSVFVWDEQEAGMRRWTDGKLWSSSRVSGRFLIYHEMEGRHGRGKTTPMPIQPMETTKDFYRVKPDGLIKQSFSMKTSTGTHLHLISYYSRPDIESSDLLQPTTDPQLCHIVPIKGMYPEPSVHKYSGTAMEGGSIQPSPCMQPLREQPQMHGSPDQCQRVAPSYRNSQGYTSPPSPVSTAPSRSQSPYRSRSGSQYTSPYQNYQPHYHHPPPTLGEHGLPYQTLYDRSTPPLLDSLLSSPSPPLSINLRISSPPILLPLVNKARRESTLSQDYAISRTWNSQPTSRAVSPMEALRSKITASQDQSVGRVRSLVDTIDSVSAMGDSTSSSSASRSESPMEDGDRRVGNIFACKKPNTWVEDQRMIKDLDRKMIF